MVKVIDPKRPLLAGPFFPLAVATVATLAMAGIILGDVDRDRRITRAQADANSCAAALAKPIPPDPRIDQLVVRTDYLRTVLRVLVREELIEGRAELPDPPPGWAPIELLPEEGAVKNTGKRAWREALR